MRTQLSAVIILMLTFIANVHAQTAIAPTTTLTAETSNNTSAADTFTTQTNGNLGATNISKVDTRTLLYPSATANIYVHFMPWFGQSSHMNVGYSSNDPAQVRRQVDDMLSRGISGAIVDWYGPDKTWNNTTTLLLMQEAETRNGQFRFAVTEDKGALQACANSAGCSVTQQLISDLTYAYNTFEGSPAYLRIGGRPAVFFFDVDRYTIDWSAVVANVPGNPLLIFRNSGGFTHSYSSGSFAWIILNSTDPNDWSQSYLDNFYTKALSYPLLHAYAATYKGFNDTLASWGANRIMSQNCGQTWLNTFNEIGNYYSGANQLENLQIVTWNDYEEGSEIESGIDNCVTVAGSTSGSALTWSITGQENTIDHYTVFISVDGYNLMPLPDVPTGTYSLDLSSFKFAPGNYTLYVKAAGKPSLKNQMSPAISFTVPDQPPVASIAVTPASGTAPVTVTASTLGSTDADGTIASSSIDFGDGAVVSGPTASHTYTAAGTYTVKGTVTDNDGVAASAVTSVTVAATPYVVTVASPANGATVNSPVHFVASTTSPYPVTGMKIYVDGVSVYSTTAAAIDTYVAMTVGAHAVTVKAWNSSGAVASQKLALTVAAPAVTYGVKITSPVNGGAYGSPVRVTASATSSKPITAMKVYVDSVAKYTVNAASLDTYLSMKSGTHTVTINAWDSGGAVFSSRVSITVK
jgi:PKD repeat protein